MNTNWHLDEDELERVIVAIIERREAFEIDSPEWLFCIRQLKALRP